MKGIAEWAMDVDSNEELAKKFEGIEDPKEMVELAKKEGYEFTEQELMDLKMESVSGGIAWGKVFKNSIHKSLCKEKAFFLLYKINYLMIS